MLCAGRCVYASTVLCFLACVLESLFAGDSIGCQALLSGYLFHKFDYMFRVFFQFSHSVGGVFMEEVVQLTTTLVPGSCNKNA